MRILQKARLDGADPKIVYLYKIRETTAVEYLLTKSNCVFYNSKIHNPPDYYISDAVDVYQPIGKIFTLVVSSANSANYKNWNKFLDQNRNTIGFKYFMPVFSMLEMCKIKPTSMQDDAEV